MVAQICSSNGSSKGSSNCSSNW